MYYQAQHREDIRLRRKDHSLRLEKRGGVERGGRNMEVVDMSTWLKVSGIMQRYRVVELQALSRWL